MGDGRRGGAKKRGEEWGGGGRTIAGLQSCGFSEAGGLGVRIPVEIRKWHASPLGVRPVPENDGNRREKRGKKRRKEKKDSARAINLFNWPSRPASWELSDDQSFLYMAERERNEKCIMD